MILSKNKPVFSHTVEDKKMVFRYAEKMVQPGF